MPPLLCSAGRSAIGVRTGRAFLVDALPPLLVWADALPLGVLVLRRRLCKFCVVGFLFAGSVVEVVWVPLVCGLSVSSPRVACCCLCCCSVFSLVCAFLQCFSVFSLLCSCVGQALLGRIKFVSIIASFLMKNVLSHSREKSGGEASDLILFLAEHILARFHSTRPSSARLLVRCRDMLIGLLFAYSQDIERK